MSEQPPAEIRLECKPQGRSGKYVVILTPGDGGAIVRYITLADVDARRKFVEEVCADRPGIDRDDLEAALEAEAAKLLRSDSDKHSVGSQADRLVALAEAAEGLELFHDADGEVYATIPVDGHRETVKIHEKGFKRWLARRSHVEHGKVPGSQGMQDALCAIAGKALFEGEERRVHVRLAEHDGEVWLDLCDEEWRAVQIGPWGWRVAASEDVPVRFIRRKGMLPLPVPERGGSLEELRPLVNMPDDRAWTLYAGWLVGTFRPKGPYAVLAVSGEQGSAKSTACRYGRGVVDPHRAALRRPSNSERDLFITAGNSWICAYNNVSGLSATISDALCALATDGGFATRELYANDEEAIFSARRPVMLNGIDDPATRSDLLDRTLTITLMPIPPESRRTEHELDAEFERVRPRVLGALLDAVAAALRNFDRVQLGSLPRIADLVIWVTAAEEALGWESGTFVAAVAGNRDESHLNAIDASPIGQHLLSLIEEGPFEGTATELREKLTARLGDAKPPKEWPGAGNGMSSAVRRLAPNLRGLGVRVEMPEGPKGHKKRRTIRLELMGKESTASDACDAAEQGGNATGQIRRTDEDAVQRDALPDSNADDAAHASHLVRTQSNKAVDPWRC